MGNLHGPMKPFGCELETIKFLVNLHAKIEQKRRQDILKIRLHTAICKTCKIYWNINFHAGKYIVICRLSFVRILTV